MPSRPRPAPRWRSTSPWPPRPSTNAAWCAAHGIHAVIGTTGLDAPALAALAEAFPADGPTGCVVAPNFAIGAVLMMRFAELAAPWFESAEIIELHHDAKVDAPSGTALLTANRMAAASADWGADPTRVEVVEGARGGEGPAGIRIHSVRLRGLVAHQEVVLGTEGQSLTIRHDSYDRRSFMPGVLLAVRAVAGRPGSRSAWRPCSASDGLAGGRGQAGPADRRGRTVGRRTGRIAARTRA